MDLRHKSFKPCNTMALRETTHTADADLFRQELANIINLRHPLVKLAQQIDWQSCESRFGDLYAAGIGRPGHPIRLMVGLQLLKHTCNVSDEEVVATWVENPYWQYFCGEQYFSHEPPIDPSLMTGFRKRIGEMGCEFILGLTLSAGLATKTVARSSLAVVNVDTTVQVRREVANIIVSPAHKAGDETDHSVGRSLPVHALLATAACEATGTKRLVFRPRRSLRREDVICEHQRGWDARLSGKVNTCELLQASL